MIPQGELIWRRNLLQGKMRERNLDGILFAQAMSMYYFSGTLQCQYVFVPAEGESVGLFRKNGHRAQTETEIPLKSFRGFNELPGLINHQAKPLRLGLEFDILPVQIYRRLSEAFIDGEILDAGHTAREVRQVKSDYEIGQIDLAAGQIDEVCQLVPGVLKEGISELELAARLEYELRRRGHQGFSRMRGLNQEFAYGHLLSGREGAMPGFVDSPTGGLGLSPASPQGAGRKMIGAGEPVSIDYSGVFNGYNVDQTRLYSLGPLTGKLNRAFSTALAIQEAIVKLLRAGTSGHDIFVRAAEIAADAGLSRHFMGYGDGQVQYVGHGVGLELNEFPVLAKNSGHCLQKNMVVAVEPKFTFPDLGVVGIENTWQITDGAPRRISLTPDAHVIL